MSNRFFNPSTGQLPDAAAVSKGLSSMTGLPQKAIMHEIVNSGLYGAHQSNQLSDDKLIRFLTQPMMMEFYRSMLDEQVQAIIRADAILRVISPITETYIRLIEVMFKEGNLTGMDQVDARSPASIQTYNEFKKALTVKPFKKQAEIVVNTLIRQLAGYDRDSDNANEVEREVLTLVGNLYTEMVKDALNAIVNSILPYGYKVLGRHDVVPFVAIAEEIDATFMAGQIAPEMAMKMIAQKAQGLNSPTVNVLLAAGTLEFWRNNMLPGREVEFLRGYYEPESGIRFNIVGQEDIGNGQLLSRGTIQTGNVTVDLWEAPVPKINSNDSGFDRMQAVRTVMGQFFTFPQNSEGLLVSGKDAEKVNNTVDVFVMDGNSGKNVVYHLTEALQAAEIFADNGVDPHPSLQRTIDSLNADVKLRNNWKQATSGVSQGAFAKGDSLNSKLYRDIPSLVRFNTQTGQFEFARRLGETVELTDTKLLQIANQLASSADSKGKGSIGESIDVVIEYLRDSVQSEVSDDFLSALILANRVTSNQGPWVLNEFGSLNIPRGATVPASGLPPLFHNVAGMQTIARERNVPGSNWREAGQRAHNAIQALKLIADGVSSVSDRQRDEMLQFLLVLIYVMEYKTSYPEGVYLRATTGQPAAAGGGGGGGGNVAAPGYQTVTSVLENYVSTRGGTPPTYGSVVQALNALTYAAPEVEALRLIEEGDKRRFYLTALLDISNPSASRRDTARRKAASDAIARANTAIVKYYNTRDQTERNRTRDVLVTYLNGEEFGKAVLEPYSDVQNVRDVVYVPETQNSQYPLPTQPASQVAIAAADVATFNTLMTDARDGDLDTDAAAFTGLDPVLQRILTETQANAVRGQPIEGVGIRSNYVLAPLVSTKMLERYANSRGENALALPAYDDINDLAISQPMQNAVFKHNVPFAGKHLRSHFSLSAPALVQNNAMDIDDEYDMLMSARPLGQPNNILGGEETEEMERRIEVIVSSTASVQDRIIASVIIGLPNTFATHQRLSKVGARLLNFILARPFETNMLSLMSFSALNGFVTLKCPNTFTSEHHSQVSTMKMMLYSEFATNVVDENRVSGICGFTSHRVVGGYNQFFLRSNDMVKDLADRPSVISIAYPDAIEFSLGDYISLFNNLPIRHHGNIRIGSKCKHPGARHLAQRWPELPELVKAAESAAVDINTNVHVAPILSRGLTRLYNPMSGRYETIRSGVSTKAKPILNSAGISEDLANGGIRTAVSTDSDYATTRLGFR